MAVSGYEKMGTKEIVECVRGNEGFERAVECYCVSGFMGSVCKFSVKLNERGREGEVRFRKKMWRILEEARRKRRESNVPEKTALLFGEVEKAEGWEEERREGVAGGLLWYYGRTGVAPLNLPVPARTVEKVRCVE